MIDRQVADFIGFPEARANYAMLSEIPHGCVSMPARQRKAADDVKVTLRRSNARR